jgi:hypothetical protein
LINWRLMVIISWLRSLACSVDSGWLEWFFVFFFK